MENNTIPVKTCPSCEGTGVLYTTSGEERTCNLCGGDGMVHDNPIKPKTLITHTPSGRIAHGRIVNGRQQ